MRTILATGAVMLLGLTAASADSWKRDGWKRQWRDGYGYYDQRGRFIAAPAEYKDESRYGGCKVERKWERGRYREEVKCPDRW